MYSKVDGQGMNLEELNRNPRLDTKRVRGKGRGGEGTRERRERGRGGDGKLIQICYGSWGFLQRF